MHLIRPVLALALLVSGCNLADAVMLWPPSGAPDADGAIRRVVPSSNGTKGIEIWTAPASANDDATRAYVLAFYGNGDRAEWHVAAEAAQLDGVAVWGVNYPGYGGSDGPATLHGVAAASLAAYDALAKEAHGKPIFAFGTSLGGTAALHVAARRDVRGVLLVNVPPLRRVVTDEYGWWNLWLLAAPISWQVPGELDSEDNARLCHAPAIFVTAEKDEIVPLALQGLVVRAYAGPKDVIVIPAGTHNGTIPPRTQQEIFAAVTRMLGRP